MRRLDSDRRRSPAIASIYGESSTCSGGTLANCSIDADRQPPGEALFTACSGFHAVVGTCRCTCVWPWSVRLMASRYRPVGTRLVHCTRAWDAYGRQSVAKPVRRTVCGAYIATFGCMALRPRNRTKLEIRLIGAASVGPVGAGDDVILGETPDSFGTSATQKLQAPRR